MPLPAVLSKGEIECEDSQHFGVRALGHGANSELYLHVRRIAGPDLSGRLEHCGNDEHPGPQEHRDHPVTASVQVQYSGVGDLNVYMWSPSGTRTKLLERNCGGLQISTRHSTTVLPSCMPTSVRRNPVADLSGEMSRCATRRARTLLVIGGSEWRTMEAVARES